MPDSARGPDELNALLITGGCIDGWLPTQAAVHLLTFTGLARAPRFGRHLTIEERWSMVEGSLVPGAWVNDWDALLTDGELHLEDAERKLLEIAASLHSGRQVRLLDQLTNLGWAHAQRIAEAILIALGATEFLSVTGTAKLAELKAMHAALSEGQSAAS